MSDPCPCWTNSAALGHSEPAHCCFLRDDRATVAHHAAWRDDVCHQDEGRTLFQATLDDDELTGSFPVVNEGRMG